MVTSQPKLTLERRLLSNHRLLIACDEVGRGALAGPVAVGAVVMDSAGARRRVPQGLRDSKLIAEHRRGDVAERASAWVKHRAVGWASAVEIDQIGILPALGTAAVRALSQLQHEGVQITESVVILDGNYDYITGMSEQALQVRPVIKADRDCASAAAASVIAKVARDRVMVELHQECPEYHWAQNKGYASAAHRQALVAHGASRHHRISWSLGVPTLF